MLNLFSWSLAVLFLASSLDAAPQKYRGGYDDENTILLRESRDNIEELKHGFRNHEAEIRIFEEKFHTLDSTIETLHQSLSDCQDANKDSLKSSAASLEMRMGSIETSLKGLTADIRQLKNHANDSSAVLAQYEEKMRRVEKVAEAHAQNMASVESAIHALTEALLVKDAFVSDRKSSQAADKGLEKISDKDLEKAVERGATKVYKVKPGDSLGKLAIEHKTTVRAIKELNQLTKDQIAVGQTLLLP